MHTSAPEPVKRWMRSVEDPWLACERADWFLYVARDRSCLVRDVAQALARRMPPLDVPPELRELDGPLRELLLACTSGEAASPALDRKIRAIVRPRLVDWNIARQFHGPVVPEGIPERATPREEPVRGWANAVLRLQKSLELDSTSDEPWAVLGLVAQYIVFERAGSSLTPLHNHVEIELRPAREAEAHRHLCDALRADLSEARRG